ncbi:secretion protein HlyD family protein [Gluconacetobacter diazotrophicus PA1 5]|uniref:Putative secretion protein, HlyD-family n=1 Tax=Gluconacetobacter diazotrophicus (strain ATCC 49037 / DSM 5601 / CCUG 37298 / CIP 103539 / LMG 7603 / PAl5) TaxID=272568 RepID=A9H2P0_GLUDA|nr:HlyD family secretion protein [Gluconacetobacter diazotrophicus]ACI52059.1 secretion protein HlyD family protein [Gluconacetobacter diazotrophicus PA1 5]TWB03078.1 membrane fusion protein (multidrug efflux system) [Gluconacetobacter diazotrophicus]CAP54179.1 putative secretion protein, HlyD-family [Gluconacetobacter diazotrophicus PA1 5]
MIYKKPLLYAGCTACVLALAAWGGTRLVNGDGVNQYTNDAYVTADFPTVAPKVAGRIDRVIAQDNQVVHAGEELAHIEDDDYRAALAVATGTVQAAQGDVANLEAELARQDAVIAQARAAVLADQATLLFARQNAVRYRNLSSGGAGTIEQQQSSDAREKEAEAAIARDQAGVDAAIRQVAVLKGQIERARGALLRAQGDERQAQLNLSYCTIPAPMDGVVGERGVRVGNYVHPGTGILAVVPTHDAYVLANFQETQLTRVQTGQRATIWVDTFPGQPLKAHVDSLAPATGVAFAPIQPDNATGNFTKVVQRIPVKLTFDPGQPLAAKVRVGMSVEANIDTSSKPEGPHANDARYAWQ